MTITANDIGDIIKKCDALLAHSELKSRMPENRKGAGLFKVSEAAKMVGRTTQAINKAESEGIVPPVERTEAGHRIGYPLSSVNILRDHFGTSPSKGLKKKAIVIAIQNFKGGVTKSSTAVNLCHALALKGFKVALMDLDSQATATSAFGYIPDLVDDERGIHDEDTFIPYLLGEKKSLHYCLRETKWSGVSLIPANLDLFWAENEMRTSGVEKNDFKILDCGLETIKDDFDVILLDSPPSLGILSVNIMMASDGLIIPCPPRIHDFSSTVQYLRMLHDVANEKEFMFVKAMISLYDKTKKDRQGKFVEAFPHIFQQFGMETIIKNLADIENAYSEFQSPFEYKHIRNKETLPMLHKMGDEVANLIIEHWSEDKA